MSLDYNFASKNSKMRTRVEGAPKSEGADNVLWRQKKVVLDRPRVDKNLQRLNEARGPIYILSLHGQY